MRARPLRLLCLSFILVAMALSACWCGMPGQCEFLSCDCQQFDYTCATFDKETSQTSDTEGRTTTRRVTYSNDHRVICNFTYNREGECDRAVCTDESGLECVWEPFSIF